MSSLVSFFLFVVTVLDLYYNFNAKEFPDYHQKRILSDIFNLLSIFLPIFLIIFISIMGCLSKSFDTKLITCCIGIITILFGLFEIVVIILSFLIQVYSIYIYFAYDGNTKIKNQIIKVLMWITLINLCINLILTFTNKKTKTNENEDNKNEELVEVKDQDKV